MVFRDYKCSFCGHRFEVREKMDSPKERPCPECDGPAKRVYSAPKVIMGGTESEKLEKLSPKWE